LRNGGLTSKDLARRPPSTAECFDTPIQPYSVAKCGDRTNPVDPAGPDCYRDNAKPWESNASSHVGAWRTAQ
jgi:hypothetical protein